MLERSFILPALLAFTFLGGCSAVSVGTKQNSEVFEKQSENHIRPTDLIAQDLVSAFEQLQGFSPAVTTVDMQRSEREDVFTQAMATALQNASYGVRWIEEENTNSLFQYRKFSEDAAASTTTDTYEVAISRVEMRRSYAIHNDRRVMPVTPLYMRGVDATGIVLNERIFERSNSQESTAGKLPAPAPVVDPEPQVAGAGINALKTLTVETQRATGAEKAAKSLTVPAQANPLNTLHQQGRSRSAVSLPLINIPREENVFKLGGSNFQDVLQERDTIAEQILTFDNDSLRMGERNKRLIEAMVEQFDPQTDVFSVIGCSMGPTNVKGGNAALALGRAGRVVESLRYAGVADGHILDEGCWAGSGSVDDLPHRGVVLTLNRKN